MIKTYRLAVDGSPAGEAPGWGEVWAGQALSERYLASTAWDGYPPVFQRYLQRPARILEAGCGLGKYVIHLGRAGHRVVGVDLEMAALQRASNYQPGLDLGAADVTCLPFPGGAFDAYISLGVIEHFEAGPAPALEEARRVLRPGGLAFISVPYQHLLKTLSLGASPAGLHRRVQGFEVDGGAGSGRVFYQYAFTRREIVPLVAAAGFRVLAAHPCSRLHWFMNRSPLRWLRGQATVAGDVPARSQRLSPEGGQAAWVKNPEGPAENPEQPTARRSTGSAGGIRSLVPVLQRLIPGWLSGHMLLVVALRE